MNATDSSNPKPTNVQVAVRCRPANSEERKGNQPTVVSCDIENKQVKVNYGPMAKKISKTFSFDKVFGMYSTQEEVFQSMVVPIVDETLAGFNCTIFAYGQTGTGKTHTMEGDIHCEENAGVIPRAVRSILEKLESTGAEFTIRVSFLELYNEELQDLLAVETTPTDDKNKLRLCEDAKKGVVCQNLEEITVLNVQHIFEILQRGIRQRQTAATLCNKNSSRSHSIFTLKIMIKEMNVDGEEVIRNGQLNLVDLAGSECVGRSGATNARAREAGSINQSLLTLGRVITALVDHHGHIPYRDSKLTRILQESLGGRAKTCIIATLSPSLAAVEESLSTLDYAHRAKSIKNAPQVNQRMTKKVVMKEYCAEIESLKLQLQITREKNGVYVDPMVFEQMEAKLSSQDMLINECEATLRMRMEEVKSLKEEVDEYSSKLEDAQSQLEEAESKLVETAENLEVTKKEVAYLKVEWVATEDVVKEQVSTETDLSSYAAELQSDVTKRQNDISNLFAKVDRHIVKESSRIENITSFVSGVDATQSTLQSSVREMLVKSDEQSTQLCSGVEDMLVRGKDMCGVLKKSIADALTVLIGDTAVAKDKMTASCDGLQSHLGETRSEVINSLQSLQDSLSEWLGGVEQNMAATQHILNQQNMLMTKFLTDVENTTVQYQQASQQFLSVQQQHSQNAVRDLSQLKADMTSKVEELKQSNASHMQQQEEMVQAKTEHIQQTMHQLLNGLLDSYKSSSETNMQLTTAMLTNMEKACSTSLTGVASTISQHDAAVVSTQQDMQCIVTSAQDTFTRHIADAQRCGNEAVSKVEEVASTAGNKRLVLDEAVTSVSTGVSSAVEKACGDVDNTAQTASGMFEEVKAASEKMDSTTSSYMADFTSYIDNQGDTLNTDLNAHFNSLKTFLSAQDTGLTSVREAGDAFVEISQTDVVKPTGSTPEKKPFKSLREINITRDHEEIKNESRQKSSKRTLEESSSTEEVGESPVKRLSSDKSDTLSKASTTDAYDEDETCSVIDGENADPQMSSAMSEASEEGSVTKETRSAKSPSRRATSPVAPKNKRALTRTRSATVKAPTKSSLR